MVTGIVILIFGLIYILLPRTEWYKDNIEYHRHTTSDEILSPIRKTIGWFFIVIGLFLIARSIL